MGIAVDERVVEMRFDNHQFERGVQSTMGSLDKLKQSLKLDGASKGLDNVNQAAKNVSLDGIASGVAALEKRFSTFGIVGMRVISNLTDSMMRFGRNTVGFVTDSIIGGGKRRAMNIENAHFQLQGLLKDEAKVQAVMDDAMDSVDGTAYAYDEAAKAASQFAASGMEAGEKMQASLRAITGVAAMTNSEYESISQIFTTVSGNGRLMGDQLLQLSSRGLNAAATLADYMTKVGNGAKVTEGEVREMVSKGEISFDLFAAAMDDAFGEHAKKANETFTGAMSNVKASLSRIGAEFISPLIVQNGPLVKLLNTLRERINDIKESIGPLAEMFVDSVTAMANAATKFLKKLDVKEPFKKFKALSDKTVDSSAWKKFAKESGESAKSFRKSLIETAREHDIAIDSMIKSEGSFSATLKNGWLTVDLITETLAKFTGEVNDTAMSLEELEKIANSVIQGSYGNGEDRIKALTEAGYDYATVQSYINHLLLDTEFDMNQLSDAQLKNSGYTEEQIIALRDLAEQAEKTGTPLNELIASMDKPSGKELLIDSFRNALKGLGKILGAIREAWKETFSPLSSDGLYGVIESIHSFSARLVMTDETADKLKRTLKGLFAVLQIISSFMGGVLGFGLRLIHQILSLLGVDILTVTAYVGDAVVAFRDWIKEHDFMGKCLEKIVFWLQDAILYVHNWVGELLSFSEAQNYLSRFYKAFKDFFGGLPVFFGGFIQQITEFIKRLKSMDSLTFENILTAFRDLKKSVVSYFHNGNGLFDGLKASLREMKDCVVSYLDKTIVGFQDFKRKIGVILVGLKRVISDNFWSITAILLGIGLIGIMKKIANAFKSVTKPIEAFTGLIDQTSNVLKDYSRKIKAEAIYAIAKSLVALAVSIAILASLDQEKVWSSVGALGAMAAGLLAFSAILGKIGQVGKVSSSMIGVAAAVFMLIQSLKSMESLDSALIERDLKILGILALGLTVFAAVLSKVAPQLSKGSFFFISFAGSLKILVRALNRLSELNIENPKETIGILLTMIGGLALVAAACRKVKLGAAVTVVAIAASLHILIGALEKIGALNGMGLKSNMDAFIQIFGMFALLMAASHLAGKNAAKAGIGILAMSAALTIIIQAFRMIADIDKSVINQSLKTIDELLIVFGGVMVLSKYAGKNAVKAGVMLFLMSGAILVLSGVMALLSNLDTSGLGIALGAILTLEVVFGALIFITKFAKDCKSTLIILASTIGMLTISLGVLSMIDPKKILSASGALSMVMGVFALIIDMTAKLKEIEDSKKVALEIAALTLVVGALAGMLFLLSGLPVKGVLGVAASLSMLILSFSNCMSKLGEIEGVNKSAMAGLGVMTLVVAGLAAVIGVLAYLNVGSTIEIAASLSALLLTLAKSMKMVGEIEGVDKSTLAALGVMTLVVGGLAAVVGVLAYLNVGSTVEIATSLSALLLALAKSMKMVGEVEGVDKSALAGLGVMTLVVGGLAAVVGVLAYLNVGSTVEIAASLSALLLALAKSMKMIGKIEGVDKSALVSLGVMTLVVAGLGAIIGILAYFNVGPTLEIATSISVLITALTNACTVLSTVGAVGSGAFVAIGALITFVVAVGALMVAIGALVTYIPEVEQWLDNGIPVLEKIGKGIGSFIGNIAGGILEGTLSGIPDIGGQLSGFVDGLGSFFEKVKGIDAQTMDGVKALAETILILTAADFLDGVASWLTGGSSLSEFGKELLPFGVALSAFSLVVQNVDAESVKKAAKAGSALAEMAKEIPNSGGLLATFTGENNMDEFGIQLTGFGASISSFSEQVTGLNVEAIKASVPAGSALAEMAKEIPNSGGLLATFTGENNMDEFGIQLTGFGASISSFSEQVTGLNVEAINAGVAAGSALAGMAKEIPESDGLFSIFTGSNHNMEDFGDQLTKFGEGLADYYESVKNMKGCNEVISDTVAAAKSLNGLATTVTNASDYNLTTFGKDLKTFGELLAEYYSSVSGIDADKLGSITDGVKKLANLATSEMLKGFSEGVSSNQTTIDAAFKTAAGVGLTTIQNECKNFKTKGNDVVNSFAKGVSKNSDNVKIPAEGVAKKALKAINSKQRAFYLAGSKAVNQFVDGIEDNAYKADTAIQTMLNNAQQQVGNALGGQTTTGGAAGNNIVNNIVSGIKEKLPNAGKAGQLVGQSVTAGANDALGVHSPSKVFTEIGGYVVDGFSNGIDLNKEKAAKSAEALAEVGVQTAKSVLESLKDSDSIFSEYVETVDENGEAVEVTLEQAAEAFKSFRNSVKDSIKDATGVFDEFKTETDIAGKQLIKNLKSQITGITEWAANMQLLAARGVNQGLLKALSDMGPSGANYVNALVTMSGKELKKMNKLYKQRLSLNNKAADEIASSFVEGGKKAAKAYDKGFTKGVMVKSGKKSLKTLAEDSVNAVSNARKKVKESFGSMFEDAVKEMKKSLDYGKGAFQQFCNIFLSGSKNIVASANAVEAASKAITAYGKKLYEESEYYKEDTKNLKAHTDSLTKLQNENSKLQKQLKKAKKSNKKDSKERVQTLKKELEANKKAISSAKDQIISDQKEIAKHTKEVYNNLRSDLSNSVAAFLDPLKASLDSGVDLFKKFESNATLYEEDKKRLAEHQKTLADLEKQRAGLQEELAKYAEMNDTDSRLRWKELYGELEELETQIEDAKNNIKQDEDDMASHSQLTVNKILENMQSQVTGVKQWKGNINKLAGKGVSEGLIAYLKNMGTDGVDYVDQFMKMTSAEISKANAIFKESQNLSAQSLLDGFKDQMKTANDFANGLNQMAKMGFGQDLLEKLGEAGPDSYDYVKAFLTMTPQQVAEFNQEYANSLKLPNTVADKVISSFAYAGSQSAAGFTSALAKMSETGSKENAALVTATNRIGESIGVMLKSNSRTAGSDMVGELAHTLKVKKPTAEKESLDLGKATLKSVKKSISKKKGKKLAKNLVDGMSNGLTDHSSRVSKTAEEVALSAYRAAKKALGIKSPSKMFAKLGAYTDAGFIEGLASGEKDVCQTASDIMGQAIKEASDLLQSDMDTEPTIRPVMDLTEIQNGVGSIGELMNDCGVSASAKLAGFAAGGIQKPGMSMEDKNAGAISRLQETLSNLLDKPAIEQHNTFTITGNDPRAIADEVSCILQKQVERRSAVWA